MYSRDDLSKLIQIFTNKLFTSTSDLLILSVFYNFNFNYSGGVNGHEKDAFGAFSQIQPSTFKRAFIHLKQKGMPTWASLACLISDDRNDVSVGAGNHVDAATLAVENDLAVDEREERVIPALADAFAGVELGAKLAHEDVARDDLLAAVSFDAAPLAVRIATVAAGALTFLMCHGIALN